jgi:hypothetical protein
MFTNDNTNGTYSAAELKQLNDMLYAEVKNLDPEAAYYDQHAQHASEKVQRQFDDQ